MERYSLPSKASHDLGDKNGENQKLNPDGDKQKDVNKGNPAANSPLKASETDTSETTSICDVSTRSLEVMSAIARTGREGWFVVDGAVAWVWAFSALASGA